MNSVVVPVYKGYICVPSAVVLGHVRTPSYLDKDTKVATQQRYSVFVSLYKYTKTEIMHTRPV